MGFLIVDLCQGGKIFDCQKSVCFFCSDGWYCCGVGSFFFVDQGNWFVNFVGRGGVLMGRLEIGVVSGGFCVGYGCQFLNKDVVILLV